ncbi:SDR family oxidoreductase [Kitasatospora sp. NPDC096147]|uniref:SDR family oxidoreductase n=1 Tax=Kitasatospora sp. NPDC096147 TaxID=3364093 RepID=UPI0037F8FE60
MSEEMTMADVVLVTGASGVLGREVVARLVARGVAVRALSRRARGGADGVEWVVGDLAKGEGVGAAVAGVRAVVHCASDIRHPKNDLPGLRHLLAAARAAGVEHVVNISIVGVDRIPYPYYRIKWQGERLLAESGLGWTNLRATQFPALLTTAFGALAKLPVLLVPAGTACQPVDQGEVAERLVELALAAPAGRVPDLGGPQVLGARELAEGWLRATGRRKRVVEVRLPGKAAAAYRAGEHTTAHADGRRTWAEYLAATVPGPARP